MARLYTCGFELQSTTGGIEFTSKTDTSSLLSIDTSVKRSGAASLKAVGGANPSWVEQMIASSAGNGPYYTRVYFRLATAPTTRTGVMYIGESGGTARATMNIETDSTLKIYANSEMIGSASAALSTGVWYRLELSYYNNTATGNTEIEGYYAVEDNTSILIAKTKVERRFPSTVQYVRVGATIATATFEANYDDWAINDSTGSYQTSFPGAGHVIHLNPSAAGDSTQWSPSTGSNWDCLDEVPLSDTDYVQQTTIDYVDLYNVQNSGLTSNITVNCVQVGTRHRNSSASASMAYALRIIKTTGGTTSDSSNLIPNTTTWSTHTTGNPHIYQLTAYTDPDGSAWTRVTLDSMQIGVVAKVDASQYIRVSKLWACVDYKPAPILGKSEIRPAYKYYTKYHAASLPSGTTLLTTKFVQANYDDVSSDNAARVSQGVNKYGMFLFKVSSNVGSPAGVGITWNGQSAIATTTKTVYLQFYNVSSTTWSTADSESLTGADTDFDLTGTITTPTDYTDANGWINVRVYQEDVDV